MPMTPFKLSTRLAKLWQPVNGWAFYVLLEKDFEIKKLK